MDLQTAVNSFLKLPEQIGADEIADYHSVTSGMYGLCAGIRDAELKGLSKEQIQEILTPARQLCGQSPFVHRVQTWPRGFPGDFETIEYLGKAENQAQPGTIEYLIEAYALCSPPHQQHISKMRWQGTKILEMMTSKQTPTILSIACGGSRDIWLKKDVIIHRKGRFIFNDIDNEALTLSSQRLSILNQEHYCILGNAVRAYNKYKEYAPFDLILAGGLFDYLDDKQIIWILSKNYPSLSTGGKLIFTNVASVHLYRVWLEYIFNWPLIERSEADLISLVEQAIGTHDYSIVIEQDSTNLAHLVEITRHD